MLMAGRLVQMLAIIAIISHVKYITWCEQQPAFQLNVNDRTKR